jgi:phage terminase large subunit GpA-like protein
MQGAVTKAEFASLVGVSRGRVSQWLRAGKIDGAAIVGEGRDARIDAELAKRQLDARLDLGQRLTVYRWTKDDRQDNEALDTMVIATGAALKHGVYGLADTGWARLEAERGKPPPAGQTERPIGVRRSIWSQLPH